MPPAHPSRHILLTRPFMRLVSASSRQNITLTPVPEYPMAPHIAHRRRAIRSCLQPISTYH